MSYLQDWKGTKEALEIMKQLNERIGDVKDTMLSGVLKDSRYYDREMSYHQGLLDGLLEVQNIIDTDNQIEREKELEALKDEDIE